MPLSPLTRFQEFCLGCTAALQIEGAARTDGQGRVGMDRFAHTGQNRQRTPPPSHAITIIFYARISAHAPARLPAFRLSISWPRIFRMGRGALNRKGLDFLRPPDRRASSIGITPWVRSIIDCRSAGRRRRLARPRHAEAFGHYAAVVVRALGDG